MDSTRGGRTMGRVSALSLVVAFVLFADADSLPKDAQVASLEPTKEVSRNKNAAVVTTFAPSGIKSSVSLSLKLASVSKNHASLLGHRMMGADAANWRHGIAKWASDLPMHKVRGGLVTSQGKTYLRVVGTTSVAVAEKLKSELGETLASTCSGCNGYCVKKFTGGTCNGGASYHCLNANTGRPQDASAGKCPAYGKGTEWKVANMKHGKQMTWRVCNKRIWVTLHNKYWLNCNNMLAHGLGCYDPTVKCCQNQPWRPCSCNERSERLSELSTEEFAGEARHARQLLGSVMKACRKDRRRACSSRM